MYREKMEKKFIFVLIAAHSKKMTKKRGNTGHYKRFGMKMRKDALKKVRKGSGWIDVGTVVVNQYSSPFGCLLFTHTRANSFKPKGEKCFGHFFFIYIFSFL